VTEQTGTKAMRHLTRLIAIAILLAGTVTLLAGRADAAGLSPRGTCTYGPCGSTAAITATVHQGANNIITLTVVGVRFAPYEIVTVVMTSPTRGLGSTGTNGTGGFDTTFQLPAGVPAGTHGLYAYGHSSGDLASTTFTTTVPSGVVQPCTASHMSSVGSATIVLAAYVEACNPTSAPGILPPAAGGAAAQLPALPRSPSELPLTGADVAGLATAGAGAVLFGGLVVMGARRRRAGRFD
jgi:LPXTG-motif cell wall-anchored protein